MIKNKIEKLKSTLVSKGYDPDNAISIIRKSPAILDSSVTEGLDQSAQYRSFESPSDDVDLSFDSHVVQTARLTVAQLPLNIGPTSFLGSEGPYLDMSQTVTVSQVQSETRSDPIMITPPTTEGRPYTVPLTGSRPDDVSAAIQPAPRLLRRSADQQLPPIDRSVLSWIRPAVLPGSLRRMVFSTTVLRPQSVIPAKAINCGVPGCRDSPA